MSEDSHTTSPYSEENLVDEDFTDILKGIIFSKAEAKKIKYECGSWQMLLYNSVDKITQNLRPTYNAKIIQTLTFARFCI